MTIEWEEKVETTRRMSLLAVHGSIGHGGATRPATLDDLRRACEVVGFERERSEWVARAEKAEARCRVLDEANAGLADERARHLGEMDDLRTKLAALTAPVEILGTRDLPRVTDEELVSLFESKQTRNFAYDIPGILAVADRVRREQCLVTRAVERGLDLHIEEDGSGSVWVIEAVKQTGHSREIEVDSPSDVARVLAEMLGEVVQ